MNIKEGINEASRELRSDEEMLINAFKLEKFFKKNKKILISLGVIITVAIIAKLAYGVWSEHKLEVANKAFLTLQKSPKDKNAMEQLASNNPKLYELYSYKKAVDENDKAKLKELSASENMMVADMSKYHLALLENTQTSSQLNKEFSAINNAVSAIKAHKMQEAKSQLNTIAEDSPIYSVASMLKHYTIKGQ
ncbi:MAG: hypothetical protein IE878_00910 [Epsilonproteobacteria bacterium]|nr:hypothetical protein [Campylobacterota bacterium]MBD3838933.1 hypothetical protein [Campylobacterota bacterium]